VIFAFFFARFAVKKSAISAVREFVFYFAVFGFPTERATDETYQQMPEEAFCQQGCPAYKNDE
jgi:hypothetical protein